MLNLGIASLIKNRVYYSQKLTRLLCWVGIQRE